MRLLAPVLALGLLLGLGLGLPAPSESAPGRADSSRADPRLPPVGTDWDYQLGGPRKVPARVGIVLRDRSASPVAGRYNICYVNGFQTQPDERRFWRNRRGLVLRGPDGRPVVDSDWGEKLLDIRTRAKRERLARIVGRWMNQCAKDGYDGVELDNLDSFTRSRGLLRARHARSYARLLTRRAHRAGLAVAQKNWPGLDGRRVGFDFAVAEECARWRECTSYTRHYGRRVLAVEYGAKDFRRACRHQSDRIAVVRRGWALGRHGVRRWCP